MVRVRGQRKGDFAAEIGQATQATAQ
jgi:hypothetical protein